MQESLSLGLNSRLPSIYNKLISNTHSIFLTPEEVLDIVRSPYVDQVRKALYQYKNMISMNTLEGEKVLINCEESELKRMNYKLFEVFETRNAKTAIILGSLAGNVYYLIEGENGCSYCKWGTSYENYILSKPLTLDLCSASRQENFIQKMKSSGCFREYNAKETSFLGRVIQAFKKNERQTIQNMLDALIERYKQKEFDIIFLPTDSIAIDFLNTALETDFQTFEILFNYFNRCRDLLKDKISKNKSGEELWMMVFKECVMVAIGNNNKKAVELLVGNDYIYNNTLSSSNFTTDELKQITKYAKLPQYKAFLTVLIINGVFDANAISNILLEVKDAPLLERANLFYSLFSDESELLIKLYKFLKLLTEEKLFILQMLRNIIRTIPSQDKYANLSIIKDLILQLKLCFGKKVDKDYEFLQLLIMELSEINFDCLENKSLFANNGAKLAFYQDNLKELIPSFERLNFPKNNNNNTLKLEDSCEKESEEDLIPTKVSPQVLLEQYRIALLDSQDYSVLSVLCNTPPKEITNSLPQLFKELITANAVPLQYKGMLYLKLAESLQNSNSEDQKNVYLLKGAFCSDVHCLKTLFTATPGAINLGTILATYFLNQKAVFPKALTVETDVCNKTTFDAFEQTVKLYGKDLYDVLLSFASLYHHPKFLLHNSQKALEWCVFAIEHKCPMEKILNFIHNYMDSEHKEDKLIALEVCKLIGSFSQEASVILATSINNKDKELSNTAREYFKKNKRQTANPYLVRFSVSTKNQKSALPIIITLSQLLDKQIQRLSETLNEYRMEPVDSVTELATLLQSELTKIQKTISNLKTFKFNLSHQDNSNLKGLVEFLKSKESEINRVYLGDELTRFIDDLYVKVQEGIGLVGKNLQP